MENNDNNYLFDLIQTIQSKMNEENTDNDINSNIKNSNTNKNNFKNDYINEEKTSNNTTNNSNNTNNNGLNISELLNNFDFSSFLGNNTSNKNNDGNNFNFDTSTIMKAQKILSSMNKEDPRKNLLLSLKPFLRKSRQDKINEYLTYLSIGSALGIFDNKRGDKDE